MYILGDQAHFFIHSYSSSLTLHLSLSLSLSPPPPFPPSLSLPLPYLSPQTSTWTQYSLFFLSTLATLPSKSWLRPSATRYLPCPDLPFAAWPSSSWQRENGSITLEESGSRWKRPTSTRSTIGLFEPRLPTKPHPHPLKLRHRLELYVYKVTKRLANSWG